MRGSKMQWGHGWLWLFAMVAACVVSVETQQLCGNSYYTTVVTINASSDVLTLPCIVPTTSQLPEMTFVWQWNKLFPDLSVERQLPIDDATLKRNSSIYTLQNVACRTTGIYEAQYLSNTSDLNTCVVYSCRFIVEVQEDRPSILVEDFSSFANLTGARVPTIPTNSTSTTAHPKGTSDVLVGVCTNGKFELHSTCVVTVSSAWYRDGHLLQNTSSFSELYGLSLSGELRIRNLTLETIGYYTCLTKLPYELGTYLTIEAFFTMLVIDPTPTPTPTIAMTTEDNKLIFGLLRHWEFGLIVANIVVVLVLVVCAGMCMVCCVVRRRKKHAGDETYQKLEEVELQTVDFRGPLEIPFSSILFEELLHKGTFKVVHHATITHLPLGIRNVHAAVKRLKNENSELGTEELMVEAYTFRSIHDKAGTHPNIVSLLGVTTQGGPTCLLLEYMPHGTLNWFLWSLKKGPTPAWYLHFVKDTLRGRYHKHVSGDLMSILIQVAEGMKFLTEHGFIHRDLSTRNVLVGDRLHVKIANPGMYQEGYYYVVTEREHFLQDMAPECIWEKRYSVWSDVWSYGVFTYKVVTLETNPYPGLDAGELYTMIVNGQRPQLLASFSNELYFLLQRCWQFVAMERPTFAEIINELKDLAIKPTRHIILKSSRDESTPGYVSENGQVFIRAVPVEGQNTNRLSQISGTYQSMISSLDDTICSKETADTLVYMHSEIETEDYSDVGFDEEARADWVDEEGSGRHVGVPNGMRVRLLRGGRDESEENGSSDGASSNGARSTQTDSDRQATSDQSESEDESCDGSRDRLASL